MANMNLQAGPFIAAGLFVALIASLSGGLVMGRWIAGQFRHDWEDQEVEEPTSSEEPAPSGGVSIAVLFFPILLILAGSVSAPFLAADSWARQVMSFAGDKNVALFAGVILASVAMRPFLRKPIDTLVVEGAASAGLILLITGAGGFFGSVISASGIGDYLVQTLSSLHVPLIFLGFILAAILRGAQGSATVALVTASSILAPMTVAAAANPLTVALGICCGSMCCSFPNDSGFWVVARFGGMSVSQTLRAWTLASSMGGLAGLGATLLIDQIF
jgi:GntP family gluconate:H+ symporter